MVSRIQGEIIVLSRRLARHLRKVARATVGAGDGHVEPELHDCLESAAWA